MSERSLPGTIHSALSLLTGLALVLLPGCQQGDNKWGGWDTSEGLFLPDLDGDGIPAGDDCDDNDATLGVDEIPYDGIDNDCDDSTPDDDLDGDGILIADDCDDTDHTLWRVGVYEGDLFSDALTGFCTEFCTRDVRGQLYIQATTMTNLSTLSCISSVEALYIYSNPLLTDLSGLSSLTSAGDFLEISSNPLLTDLDGLGQIRRAGQNLRVYSNASLQSLRGLDGIDQVGEDLTIQDNPSLTDVTSLHSLSSLGDDLFIKDNAVLSTSQANALRSAIGFIGGTITISGNDG